MPNILQNLNRLVGLDLGTARTKVWVSGQGIVFNEYSCIAVDKKTGKLLAIGNEAAEMESRVGDQVVVNWLVKDGEIVNTEWLEIFVKVLLKKLLKEVTFIKPIVMVSVPSRLSSTKKELLVEVFYKLGMRDVYTISQPLAAAIGAGVPVADASGCFLIHLGAGLVEGAIISLGRVIYSKQLLQAGDFLSEKIAWEVKREMLVELGHQEIKKIKSEVCSFALDEKKQLTVIGNDLKKKAPKEIIIDSEFVSDLVARLGMRYERLVSKIMSEVPPELTNDVLDKGILLSGGLANLQGLGEFLSAKFRVPVFVADECDLAVIRGISVVMENLDLYKESLGYGE